MLESSKSRRNRIHVPIFRKWQEERHITRPLTVAVLVYHRRLYHPLDIWFAHFGVLEYTRDARKVEGRKTEKKIEVCLTADHDDETLERCKERTDVGSGEWRTRSWERQTGRNGILATMFIAFTDGQIFANAGFARPVKLKVEFERIYGQEGFFARNIVMSRRCEVVPDATQRRNAAEVRM
jgi:hypothetical protein